jgi:hypothetical protein
MWVVRELSLLIFRIAFVAAIAIIFAGLWALASGDFTHNMRVMFFLFGALLILLAGAGNRSTGANQRLGWLPITSGRGNAVARWSAPRPEDPKLSAGAVFIGSGAVLVFLGFLV